MDVETLKSNIYSVTERIAAATEKRRKISGSADKVTLVAAVKTVPADVINAAIELGVTDIGENRVQELVEKRAMLKSVVSHFIGTLQRNKAKYLVGNVALIQSVSSVALAEEISRLSEKRGVIQDVLVEVNVGGEATKTGAPVTEADRLIDYTSSLKNVRLRGIMAVPPQGAGADVYESLYALYKKHKKGLFDTLSVGMSGDFETAIEYGSNMVRVGSAIFGKRV